MNRGTGVTAGAILLAGALLRPGATRAPQAPAEQPASRSSLRQPTTSASGKHTGEGPWRASCEYWAPGRSLMAPKPEKSVDLTVSIRKSHNELVSHIVAAADDDQTDCERDGDPWGIPAPAGSLQPSVTAIIAVVPDPIHTHLALGFDRSIDALMQAAGDNNYTKSFYWLPWKSLNEGTRAPAPLSPAELAEQHAREQMPGLIILRAFPQKSDPAYPWPSYSRVIYLFLVGESPSAGMNSTQLRNAFRYEEELKREQGRKGFAYKLSMRGEGDLALIGSPASGAAASLRETLEQARSDAELGIKSIHIAGTTSTEIASDLLNKPFLNAAVPISYLSFGEDATFEERETLRLLHCSGYQADRFAVLIEDGTVYGQSSGKGVSTDVATATAAATATPLPCPTGQKGMEEPTAQDAPRRVQQTLVVRFPREISLLRNAQAPDSAASSQSGATPSPYLHLSLKDPNADDTIPYFSIDQTPLSQEAELMSIQQELLRYHAQFIAIYASNILDEIFLANFLHRSCPDARLVFLGGGDLLLERETENEPYIGSITMTPYNLVDLWRLPGHGNNPRSARAFADSQSEGIYNAASYTFNEKSGTENPTLAGYQSPVGTNGRPSNQGDPKRDLHPSLWATIVGNDGYYPLGIINHQASDNPLELPVFTAGDVDARAHPDPPADSRESDELQQFERSTPVYPALLWFVLSGLIGFFCLSHAIVILIADFWSPFTRDLAIHSNDQPRRRSIYINIGTSMLFCMAFVVNYPLFQLAPSFHPDFASKLVAEFSLAAAAAAVLCTIYRTWAHVWRMPEREVSTGAWNGNHILYIFFNAVAIGTLIAVPLLWARICRADLIGTVHTKIGLFFSYRCLHPDSGVSPVVPVLFLLLSWYIWSFCQAFRLRFSRMSRPRLPRAVLPASAMPLFVSDDRLEACKGGRDSCLYDNISSLLITREILYRFLRNLNRMGKNAVSCILALAYLGLFVVVVHYKHIESVDRLLVQPDTAPTPYEALIAGLFLPLVFVALAGWLRMILVWGSLSRTLLEPLEQLPLRHAFTRLKGLGWMAMLRETGLHLRWRDMARTIESMRQLLYNEDLQAVLLQQPDPRLRATLDDAYVNLNRHLTEVGAVVNQKKAAARLTPFELPTDCQNQQDSPIRRHRAGLELICAIEQDFAQFSTALLDAVLIPYWTTERGGFIEGASTDATPIHASRKPKTDDQPHDPIELHAAASSEDPTYIRLGEELLALRYVSLIRAVLGNMSYLMTFVSFVFVLTIVAWNSYPFQPRQWIDWSFTLLLIVLGIGFIWVFAQMHRNAILSRITDTTPNELGSAFYWRIATFGALPLITWLAYQFPQLGGGIFRILQPGLNVLK